MLTRDLSAVANLLVSHWLDSPVRYHQQKVSDVYVSDMLTPAADVTSRAMRSSTNCDYFVHRTTLSLSGSATGRSRSLPPSLESAAIRTEDDDVLDQHFQETPQNFFYI